MSKDKKEGGKPTIELIDEVGQWQKPTYIAGCDPYTESEADHIIVIYRPKNNS